MTKLHFGTAGLRAPLGEGPEHINADTLRALALALAEYLPACFPDATARGVCIGYDGRRGSSEFARAAAEVLLARGFVVHLFANTTPTPVLAFATRTLDAAAGVMVTASHNPPSDNGVKVYLRGGVQVVSPHDREIEQRMHAVVEPDGAPRVDLDEAGDRGQLLRLGAVLEESYLDAVEGLLGPPEAPRALSVAYTAMCGVGGPISRKLFARRPVSAWAEVAAQGQPRADFGGLKSPNPEQAPALAAVLALAEERTADLVLAHDPDADRLAVAARDRGGALRVLTGDEVGVLLGDSLLSTCIAPERALLVSTVVSSDWLSHVARARGATFAQTLTGFKWIAETGQRLSEERGLRYLFGYEEAIGYAFPSLGADKDGIAAAALITELAGRLGSQGKTLWCALEQLAREHGLFATRQLTVREEGPEGRARIDETMAKARSVEPRVLLGTRGASRVDYASREPQADLVVFEADGGLRLCVRPSGTEPKLKLYLQVRVEVGAGEPIDAARQRAERGLDQLEMAARSTWSLPPG